MGPRRRRHLQRLRRAATAAIASPMAPRVQFGRLTPRMLCSTAAVTVRDDFRPQGRSL